MYNYTSARTAMVQAMNDLQVDINRDLFPEEQAGTFTEADKPELERLFLTACAYIYEHVAISVISDTVWDDRMKELAPKEIAYTGYWIYSLVNQEEIKDVAFRVLYRYYLTASDAKLSWMFSEQQMHSFLDV